MITLPKLLQATLLRLGSSYSMTDGMKEDEGLVGKKKVSGSRVLKE